MLYTTVATCSAAQYVLMYIYVTHLLLTSVMSTGRPSVGRGMATEVFSEALRASARLAAKHSRAAAALQHTMHTRLYNEVKCKVATGTQCQPSVSSCIVPMQTHTACNTTISKFEQQDQQRLSSHMQLC